MLEGLVADVAPLSKVVIVAIWAVKTIVLSYKLLVSQRTYKRKIELLKIIHCGPLCNLQQVVFFYNGTVG